jgi:hypothetical protein
LPLAGLIVILAIILLPDITKTFQSNTAVTATTTATIRLRAGPGIDFERIGLILRGTTLLVLGRDRQGDWLLVEQAGVKGWIAGWYCQINGNLMQVEIAIPPGNEPSTNHPTLANFWNGDAIWVLDVLDTGLPVGESDTIYMGDGEYWSYLHASHSSAGIVDSCGDPVEFPGCVTRWVSTDGGRQFELAAPTCLLPCDSCPCGEYDRTWQQQYPRVVRDPVEGWTMVFETGASSILTFSKDGLNWTRPRLVPYTGVWDINEASCRPYTQIGEHPFIFHNYDCMAGGPPGLVIADGRLYVLVGLGQSPGNMGCYWAWLGSRSFSPCEGNPLLMGSDEYGPLEASGDQANPYFDFRYITSADVVYSGGWYYTAYEGIRGPSSPEAGGDDQFALGFARSQTIGGQWEAYPGNPVLGDVSGNWGIGHADVLIVDGVTYMYTATPALTRGRYMLQFIE